MKFNYLSQKENCTQKILALFDTKSHRDRHLAEGVTQGGTFKISVPSV